MIVPVLINGSGPYDLLLDTGSTSTAVDRELSESLQLEPKNKGMVTTLVRTIAVSGAVASTVRIGPVSASRIELLVRDFDGLRNLDPALRGVLGEDVLRQTDFLLDYKHRSIEFDRDGEVLRSLSGERIPFSNSSDRNRLSFWIPSVVTTIEDGASRGRILALDTGTASLVLFVDQSPFDFAGRQTAVQDDGGMQKPAGLRTVMLHIRHKTWLMPAQELVQRGYADDDLRGLLPTSLFRCLYISNSGSFVVFDPAGTHSSRELR